MLRPFETAMVAYNQVMFLTPEARQAFWTKLAIFLAQGQKIPAIKFVRDTVGCSLVEGKDWVDLIMSQESAMTTSNWANGSTRAQDLEKTVEKLKKTLQEERDRHSEELGHENQRGYNDGIRQGQDDRDALVQENKRLADMIEKMVKVFAVTHPKEVVSILTGL